MIPGINDSYLNTIQIQIVLTSQYNNIGRIQQCIFNTTIHPTIWFWFILEFVSDLNMYPAICDGEFKLISAINATHCANINLHDKLMTAIS